MKYSRNMPALAALVALAIASLLVSAYAAGPGLQAKRPGMQMGLMGPELGLSDAQKAKIQAIRAEYQPRMQRIRQSNLTPEQKRTRMMALRQEMMTKISAVLTPEQRAKLQQMRANRGERRQDLEACLKSLNLSDKQKTAIRAINRSTMAQVQAVRADTGLDQAQKRMKIQNIRKSGRQQIMKTLTPAQRNELTACLKSHRQ